MPIQTVSIVGVGLIGGSFALALRHHGFAGRILGVSSERTLRAAMDLGVVDQGVSLEQGVRKADLVYLSQPIGAILDILPQVSSLARKGTLVTDAGSTKAAIVERAIKHFGEGISFLGGHPMAGKEQRGVEQADPNLFRDACYVLTPADGQIPEAPHVDEFLAWLSKIGARTLVLPPAVHDEVVTWTSHLPQLVSSALAATVAEQVPSESQLQVAGPGLRDMTRLAASPHEIWRDVFATNRANVERAVTLFVKRLEEFKGRLGGSGLEDEFKRAQAARQRFRADSES